MKFLAVGDIHLGRRPSRLPEALRGRAGELGPAGAWGRVVDAAIRKGVDAVALAGDVVERENDFFEAYRELHRGVARLAGAGIRVFGVAGNHDVQVLPRLADEIPDFTLLGRGGHWESVPLEAARERLTLWGWSFPRTHVPESPLAGVRFERRPGLNLGLLHCDRDQPGSPYAPVPSRELDAAGLDGWLLGHIHRPDALTAPAPSGYLGSLTGMDPGEAGPRGPWLITIEGGRIRAVDHWTLAPLRWESLAVDLTGITDQGEIPQRLLNAVRDFDGALSARPWWPEAVGLRITFVGRSRFGETAARLISDEDRENFYTGANGTHYFIERLAVATEPEIRIETIAERNDPAGLLARRLLLLERPADDPDRLALIAEARRRLEAQHRDTRWGGLVENGVSTLFPETGASTHFHGKRVLTPSALDDATVAAHLRRTGGRLLAHMLAQQGAAP